MSAGQVPLTSSRNGERSTTRSWKVSRPRSGSTPAPAPGPTSPGPQAPLIPRTKARPIPAPALIARPPTRGPSAIGPSPGDSACRREQVAWDDLFLGRMSLDPSRLGGDFLVGRNGLGPSYQLAVVVDDALMGVNQVIRGDDLVPSTPRQILLYRALGRPEPTLRPRPPGRHRRTAAASPSATARSSWRPCEPRASTHARSSAS